MDIPSYTYAYIIGWIMGYFAKRIGTTIVDYFIGGIKFDEQELCYLGRRR